MAPKIMLMLLALSLLFLEIPSAVKAVPDETYGTVINVVDGNTFDIAIEKSDPRIISNIERVTLADISSPGISTAEGLLARDFAAAVLMNKRVYLDIDDFSVRDHNGRLVCVVYLMGLYGQPIVSPCFNRMLVDSGYAKIENSTNNEFDPSNWWPASSPENLLLPEPSEAIGKIKRFEDMLNQSSGSANDIGRLAGQAGDWLHNRIGQSSL